MRVLHIGKYFPPHPGGMESFLGDLTTAQVRRGHAVAVVVHGPQSRITNTGGLTLYEAKAGRQILYAPVSPGFTRTLSRAIRDFRPDIIHVHVPNLSAFWLLLSKAGRRIPWVVQWQSDVHVAGGPWRLRLPYQFYRLAESALLRRAVAIICSTPDYRDASRPLRPWLDKTRVVPLGVDPGRVAPRGGTDPVDGSWNHDGALKVLVVGRLAHYKGHRHLLDALELVSDVRVVVAGDGELKSQLQGYSERLGLRERVRFLGSTDAPGLRALFQAADVVCLPSTARTESFGIVLLEAMAFSRPVLASDVPGSGMPWVVRSSGHGMLAAPRDPDSLAQALEALKDEELRLRLGRAGRKALETDFHIDRVAGRIDSIYEEILQEGRA